MKAGAKSAIAKIKRLIAKRAPFNDTISEAVFIKAIADQQNSMSTRRPWGNVSRDQLVTELFRRLQILESAHAQLALDHQALSANFIFLQAQFEHLKEKL